VPPFVHLTGTMLGVHRIQAAARERGLEVAVLYANLLFARQLGLDAYAQICDASQGLLFGERIFARAAFGVGALARPDLPGDFDVHEASRRAESFCEALGERIAAVGYRVVGATLAFEQTAAAVALLQAVKSHDPSVVTILGGPSCDGEMAEGHLSLSPTLDHAFSGEADHTFPAFLEAVLAGDRPTTPVIHGEPIPDLDTLPLPRFDEYLDQVDRFLPDLRQLPLWLSYETSRGCWWGQKRRCTFCGVNGSRLEFRVASPDKILSDLEAIVARHGVSRVCMSDTIVPFAFHRTLFPRLSAELPGLRFFYELKANLDLDQVQGLVDAGVHYTQPGIESLSTPLLQRMHKGVTARQNVALLRYARITGLQMLWNVLYGFPGDQAADYEQQLALMPLLHHLPPPHAVVSVVLQRFGVYVERPEEHGLVGLEPHSMYREVFPPWADLDRLALTFDARYPSESLETPELIAALEAEVVRWSEAWATEPERLPTLAISPAGPDSYVLHDTRGLGGPTVVYLGEAQAAAALVGGPLDRGAASWAIGQGYAAEVDGLCVPLATSSAPMLRAFEQRHRRAGAPDPSPRRVRRT